MEPNDQKFKDLVSQKNVKNAFEATVLFHELYIRNFRTAGTWVGDTWHYDHPIIQEHYETFSEGFVSGVADYYITSADEEHQKAKRMNAQIYESAGDDEIFLDISPYLK